MFTCKGPPPSPSHESWRPSPPAHICPGPSIIWKFLSDNLGSLIFKLQILVVTASTEAQRSFGLKATGSSDVRFIISWTLFTTYHLPSSVLPHPETTSEDPSRLLQGSIPRGRQIGRTDTEARGVTRGGRNSY